MNRSSSENSLPSPVVNRGFRRPFGELTNTPPSSHKRTFRAFSPNSRPAEEQRTPGKRLSSTPDGGRSNGAAALTPLANLKLLMRVASESAAIGGELQEKPSRRELFKGEEAEDLENNAENSLPLASKVAASFADENIHRRLVVDDHDYSSDKSASQTPTSNCSSILLTPSPFHPTAAIANAHSNAANNVKVSRKDKSLGLLCDKFISRFPKQVPTGEKCDVQLDDLAKQMGTERRRIYDIVNVLESVQMMTKVGKNLYQWHGTTHQRMTLARLRQIGIKFDMLQRYLAVKAEEQNGGFGGNAFCPASPLDVRNDSVCSTPASSSFTSSPSPRLTPMGSTPSSSSIAGTPGIGQTPSPSAAVGAAERKTSLGKACQRFLMLFLVLPEPHAKLNLEIAARVIHGPEQETVMKTRIRRLYDIANILQSLRLIQKVTVADPGGSGGKKPAFQYIGPNIDGIEVTREALETLPTARQRHSLLAIGKNLANLPDEPPNADDDQQMQQRSYFSLARKRMTPDSGFSSPMVARGPKLVRTQSSENAPVSNFHFAVPHPSPSSFRRSVSLQSAENIAVQEQTTQQRSPLMLSGRMLHLRPITSAQSQRQLFKQSPINLSSRSIILSPVNAASATILKPPPSPQSQPQDLSLRRRPSPSGNKTPSPVYPRTKKQQVMRLVGLARGGSGAERILVLSPKQQQRTQSGGGSAGLRN